MAPYPANLVESWLAVELAIPGRSIADALDDLNGECTTRVDHSRLSQWRRGLRTPSPAQCRYMARCCLLMIAARLIARAGLKVDDARAITDNDLDAAADALTPPPRHSHGRHAARNRSATTGSANTTFPSRFMCDLLPSVHSNHPR